MFAVDSQLPALGLQRCRVAEDGNCQFHSVALQCDFHHTELRSLALAVLRESPADFIGFVDGSWSSYLEQMEFLGSWGDHVTLCALSRALSREIRVVKADGVEVISPPLRAVGPVIWLAYSGVHYDACLALSQAVAPEPPPAPLSHNACDSAPGLSFASCNVTSLKKNYTLVSGLADCIGLQETRHTSLSTSTLSARLSTAGYTLLFGKCMPHRARVHSHEARTMWNGKPGGVALAVRDHMPCQVVPVGDCPVRKQLWNSCRWLHAVVAYGSGKHAFHVFVFYGFSGAYSNPALRDSTEELLRSAFEVAHQYRNLPVVFLSDLNMVPSDSDSCRHACLKGGWVDAAAALDHLAPTHFPSKGTARRLDVVLLNSTAAVSLQKYSVLEDSGLPSHRPVRVSLNLKAFQALFSQLVRPLSFRDLPSCKNDVTAEPLARSCFQEVASEWASAFAAADTEKLFRLFSLFSEKFLCLRASVSCAKHCGRGHVPKFSKQPARAPSRPISCGGQQASFAERRLRKLARQCEELLRQAPSSGAWPHHLQSLWFSAHSRAAACGIQFSVKLLSQARDEAIKQADALHNTAEYDAIARWRNKIQKDFQGSKRATFRWFSRKFKSSQPFVQHEGAYTACPVLTDTLIRAVWEPVFNRKVSDQIPSWEEFLSHFERFFPDASPLTFEPLTAERLRSTLSRMSPFAASGLDCWEVASLKALPDFCLEKLCTILSLVEDTGRWPSALTFGYFSLIPKPDSDDSPASLRPLSILSVVYRTWASCRLSELMRWQSTWVHDKQFGFCSNRSATEAWYELALNIEASLLQDLPLTGCFLDFEKAFDLVPLHEVVLPLAQRLGLPSGFCLCLKNFYGGLVRFFKFGKGFGSALQADRGVVQGCPLSVVLLNLLVMVLFRAVDATCPSVTPRGYADDISASSMTVDGLSSFLQLAGKFASVTMQRLKPKKCKLWSLREDVVADLQALRVAQSSLEVIQDFSYLGASFGFHRGVPHNFRLSLFDGIKDEVGRVACLPLPAEQRVSVVAVASIPKALHACELSPPPLSELQKLRTACLKAVWRGRKQRAPEALTCLFYPGHRFDPVQATPYRTLLTLRRMCKCHPEILTQVQEVWSRQHSGSGVSGPVSSALKATSALNWGWGSFEVFQPDHYPAFNWLSCSRGFFMHRLRESLRQVQFGLAVVRCEHYSGLGVLDRDSSVWFLRKLLRTKQHYAAGTLKAVLSNAVTTAVGFHRAKTCDSPICPFCEQGVEENLLHIFDECPAWESLRTRFKAHEHAALPVFTRLTGVVEMQQPSLDALHSLAAPDTLCDASRSPCPSDALPQTWENGCLVVYTDGACFNQDSSFWRRAGYGVVYDSSRQHSMTVSCPLLGLEQTAQRAELRAFLHVLAQDSRPLLIHTDSAYVVQLFSSFVNRTPLPLDGDNLDISRKVLAVLAVRASEVRVVKVKGHSSNPLNDAADCAAKSGASVHHTDSFLSARRAYWNLRKLAVSRQRLLVSILVERCRIAKSKHLLSFSKSSRVQSSSPVTRTVGDEYLYHSANFDGVCLQLSPLRPFSRSLRYCFGQLCYDAVSWYVSQLRFPDVPLDSTRGITWLELVLDFELATAVRLPGAEKNRVAQDGSRWRRGAADGAVHMLAAAPPPEVQHDIMRIPGAKRPRYRCKLCLREGAWDTRSQFLRFTCAGKPETRAEAVRRHRLNAERARLQHSTVAKDSVASLGERSQSFANAFRAAVSKNSADPNNLLKPALLACRSLAPFSLPLSAGLARRPILLQQSLVTAELRIASELFNQGTMPSSDAWHSFWFPSYDKEFTSAPLWRPREPD